MLKNSNLARTLPNLKKVYAESVLSITASEIQTATDAVDPILHSWYRINCHIFHICLVNLWNFPLHAHCMNWRGKKSLAARTQTISPPPTPKGSALYHLGWRRGHIKSWPAVSHIPITLHYSAFPPQQKPRLSTSWHLHCLLLNKDPSHIHHL